MINKILTFILVFGAFYLISISTTQAAITCDLSNDQCKTVAGSEYVCKLDPLDTSKPPYCQKTTVGDIFGQIKPPGILGNLVANSKTSGAGVISQFLSNLILLIYSIAGIVLVFMIIWGAFEWLTSGGDKEKIEGARKRIISAIVGIILFAVAFAIIQVFGIFTGFTFFSGQKDGRTPPIPACDPAFERCT